MSLLLDALKKAAEAKSRNDGDPAAEDSPQVSAETAEPSPPLTQRPPAPFVEPLPAEHAELESPSDDAHNDTMGQRFSQYDEFDETQQLEGDFGEKTSNSYGSPKHAESVFASKSAQKPLRGRFPFFKITGSLLLISGCAAATYYYVQERDYALQRQLSNIRKQAPIVPLTSSEENASQNSQNSIELLAVTPTTSGTPAPLQEVEEPAVIPAVGETIAVPVSESATVSENYASTPALGETVASEESESASNDQLTPAETELVSRPAPVPTVSGKKGEMAESSFADSEAVREKKSPTSAEVPLKNTPDVPSNASDTTASVENDPVATASAQKVTTESGNLSISHSRREQEADIRVREAYAAYQAGHFETAEALYTQALQRDPGHRDALLGRAAIYLQRKQNRNAIAIYRQLLAVNPRDHAALAGLNSLAREGNVQRYESDLRFLLKETPQSAALNYALGVLLSRQQRWADAQQHFFAAFAEDAQNPDLAYNLAVSLDNLGKASVAAEFYSKALELAKNRAAGFDKVQAYRRLQKLEQ